MFLTFVFLVVLFVSRMLWSYQGTDLMLRPDGAGIWSVHMATRASLQRSYYAKTKKDFIYNDILTILNAAHTAGLKGKIVLESHLFGTLASRMAEIARLQSLFPHWQYDQRLRAKPLGQIYAWRLTKLRGALFERLENQGKKISDAKKVPMRATDPVGIVEITIC